MRSFNEWTASRRLTSQRAGAGSQRFAAQRLDRYVRSNAKQVGVVGFVITSISFGTWLLLGSRPGMQGLITGLTAGVGFTMLYHWCVLSSGAAASTMGQAAEEWTDAELRRLHRKGWKHVNHLVIKPALGDIDHVAVGPDGVIVVETKWSSFDEDVDQLSKWKAVALQQAQRNRQQVVQLLNWHRRDPMLVQALVVLWGPQVTHESAEAVLASGVNVTAGPTLRDDLAALGDERLSPEEIQTVYAALVKRIGERDRWELDHLPPASPTLQEQANRWARRAVAAWCGLFASTMSLQLGWWAFAMIVLLAAAAGAARRVEQIRTEATAFLVGVVAPVPLVLIVVASTLV